MVSNTPEQSRLALYAQDVLRQNGIKTCQLRWPNPKTLVVTVDPSKAAVARRVIPTLQVRAAPGIRVVLDEPGADLVS